MQHRSWFVALAAAAGIALSGCPKKQAAHEPVGGGEGQAPRDTGAAGGVDRSAPPAPSHRPAEPVSRPAQAKSCLRPFRADGEPSTFTIAGKRYERRGDVVRLLDEDADDVFTFGHLTDIKEDTPENLGNVLKLIGWLQGQGADALVVTGDLGESEQAIERVMRALAAFHGPVFVMMGIREGKTDFAEAFAAASADHPNLINMNEVRLFVADDASLVSLPGYFNAPYIHSQDGCLYLPDDVAALAAILEHAKQPVVLASHGPPLQRGATAIDRIHEGANVGDPTMAKFIAEHDIRFGLFGNIHEAGGKATDLSGENIVREGQYVDSLYLNPGPADSVRWPMLDGTESVGMGGLLRLKGGKGMYKIHRLRPGEAHPVRKLPDEVAAASAEPGGKSGGAHGATEKATPGAGQ